jgi:pimeloyl-ACP methyl ester carboxylesterase
MSSRLPLVVTVASLLCAGATAASCGSAAPDPLAPYRTQSLAWQACDPTIIPADYAPLLDQLESRVQCAMMRVPLDYADPGRGEAVVALLRVAAEGGAPRKGAILFNPGGPGDDGLVFAVIFGSLWTNANPLDPSGALFHQVSQSYDLVGFSPRGVGASTRLYCGSNELQPFVANMSRDRSPANVQAMLDKSRLIAEACRKNPLTPFINSEGTAQDMDLVRHLLGDEKLNYWGYSYGTWLGAWYASRFPGRVGRMVLGGTVDLTGTLPDDYLTQAMGMQRVLDDVLAPYAARHPELFGLGSDAAAVRAVHPSLSGDLQEASSELLSGFMGAARTADSAVLGLRAAQVLQAILDAHPLATEEEVAALVDAATFVPLAGPDKLARSLAQSLRASYFVQVGRERTPVSLAGSPAAQWTITCNDVAMTRGATAWMQENDRLAATYPFMGGYFSVMPCMSWGGPSVARPALEPATRAGGIVMLQSQLDPQTPLEGALKSWAALPNASLVQIDGEITHAVGVPYGRPCIDLAIGEYLVAGTQPSRETRCEGKPLPADAAGVPAAAAPGTTFRDPALARRAMDQLGRVLHRN